MDDKLYTFLEAKQIITAEIENVKNELISKLRDNFETLAKITSNDTFRMAEILFSPENKEIKQEIAMIQNTIAMMAKLDHHEQIETHYKFKESPKFKSMRLTNDKGWQEKIKSTLPQMQFLMTFIMYKEKYEFHAIFSILTNNESMAQRYTKYIFGSGIKHSKS